MKDFRYESSFAFKPKTFLAPKVFKAFFGQYTHTFLFLLKNVKYFTSFKT